MKDIINILDLSVEEIDSLINTAEDIQARPGDYREECRGRILATLFFEPSTRTRLSFESAMLGLGGSVLGFAEEGSSSVSKGESISDTARMVESYSDIIVMRHYLEGAPCAAGLSVRVPVINGGDGGHYHPTQTLADILTIKREKGRLGNITIGICGDLKYGRTVHSLVAAAARYEGIKFVFISPKSLALPGYVKHEFLDGRDIPYIETESLEDCMGELDVLYMTRIQKERFDAGESVKAPENYILTPGKLRAARADMSILHPLPRVDEISVEVDSDSRAKYFEQARNGRFMRMALILMLLSEGGEKKLPEDIYSAECGCKNPRCIAASDPRLARRLYLAPDRVLRCRYCDCRAR